VALGICRKVKIIYRLVGHTKNEVDQCGGIVSNKIRSGIHLTPQIWLQNIKDSVKEGNQSYRVVDAAVETIHSDYDSEFKSIFGRNDIGGLARLQEIR
jgi:hypothetical protein